MCFHFRTAPGEDVVTSPETLSLDKKDSVLHTLLYFYFCLYHSKMYHFLLIEGQGHAFSPHAFTRVTDKAAVSFLRMMQFHHNLVVMVVHCEPSCMAFVTFCSATPLTSALLCVFMHLLCLQFHINMGRFCSCLVSVVSFECRDYVILI